jgi:dTDP-4-dehydrorhamnose 3,5-epimerase
VAPALTSRSTNLPGVKILTPRRIEDARGWFAELWNERSYAAAGITAVFVQDNTSFNTAAGTVRGLHFQRPPSAQGKLVWVAEGAAFDVVVDLRTDSPTFGGHIAVTLTAAAAEQIWVPEGFAHGYCTLVPGTRVVYKVTGPYDPQAEGGVRFDDPALGIAWPVDLSRAVLSDRDRALPLLKDLPPAFHYRGESP